jgi:hypothetical protein
MRPRYDRHTGYLHVAAAPCDDNAVERVGHARLARPAVHKTSGVNLGLFRIGHISASLFSRTHLARSALTWRRIAEGRQEFVEPARKACAASPWGGQATPGCRAGKDGRGRAFGVFLAFVIAKRVAR